MQFSVALSQNHLKIEPRTGAVILVIVGTTLLIWGALFGVGMSDCMLQLCCTSFALLNGVMSAITGFARIGHFTGVLMNVGLLIGQLTNPENHKPEIWWKLKQSCNLVLCWCLGTASQCLLCNALRNTKYVIFKKSWVYLMFPGAGMVLLGSLRLFIRAMRIHKLAAAEALLDPVSDDGQPVPARGRLGGRRVALVDNLVLETLQNLGGAGGFTLDQSLYPKKGDFNRYDEADVKGVFELGVIQTQRTTGNGPREEEA